MTPPTQAQIEAAFEKIADPSTSWGHAKLIARETLAALTAAAEVGEAGIGGPTEQQVHNIMNATIKRCAQVKMNYPLDLRPQDEAMYRRGFEDAIAAIRALKDQL